MEMTRQRVEDLIEKYGDMVLRIAVTYLKNKADAEDTVQDMFLKIIDKKPEFKDKQHEKLWIVRTTVNMCKNKFNLFWNKNRCSEDSVPEDYACDVYKSESNVFAAVMALPQKYRAAVYLCYYEGYKTAEIAKIMKTSDTAVRSLLHRARKTLKETLKEDYDFE